MRGETLRLLFIGNSFTSRHQLPQLIAALAAQATSPRRVVVQTIVAGGASLRRHWNGGIAQQALAAGRWDDVVLQEQSTLPIKNPQRYHENVRLFAPEIARNGARCVLYLTWARRDVPYAHAQLTAAVESIGAEVGALVVPVGRAWQAALQQNPEMTLHADDGSHPSAAGSYLAACTFLVALFGERPVGQSVSDRLGIEPEVAARLRAIAWATASSGGHA